MIVKISFTQTIEESIFCIYNSYDNVSPLEEKR
jgi:hypothetical protein